MGCTGRWQSYPTASPLRGGRRVWRRAAGGARPDPCLGVSVASGQSLLPDGTTGGGDLGDDTAGATAARAQPPGGSPPPAYGNGASPDGDAACPGGAVRALSE